MYEKEEERYFEEDSDTDADDVHQVTKLNSLKKMDSCTTVDLEVGEERLPEDVGEDSMRTTSAKQMIMMEVMKYLQVIKVTNLQKHVALLGSMMQGKTNNKNNMAIVMSIEICG